MLTPGISGDIPEMAHVRECSPSKKVSSTAPNSAQSGVGDTFPDRIITTGLRGTPDWISARAVDESETEK